MKLSVLFLLRVAHHFTVANYSSVQLFMGLIFVGVACPWKLVPNKNVYVYDGTSYLGIGQVQNGRLYIRYRSSYQKNKAKEFKKLTDYFPLLLQCKVYSISSTNLWQGLVEKTKPENFNFVCLSFLLATHNSKLYHVCKYCPYQMTALLKEIISTCFELRVSYNWQVTA